MKPLSCPYFVTTRGGQEQFSGKRVTVFLRSDDAAILAALFYVATYWRAAFRKPADINDGWISYVQVIQRPLSDTGSSTTQPLSSAVSHGKELYNTNSPRASPVTVV